jgi:hypothetical protein
MSFSILRCDADNRAQPALVVSLVGWVTGHLERPKQDLVTSMRDGGAVSESVGEQDRVVQ